MFLKEQILPHYQNPRFFEHKLILTKCLALCMFELTDVYYIYSMSIIFSSRCFPCKSFLGSSKLYICLTKLLPTLTSIWLNYINSFLIAPDLKLSSNCLFISPKRSGYDCAINLYLFHIYFHKYLTPLSYLTLLAHLLCDALELG